MVGCGTTIESLDFKKHQSQPDSSLLDFLVAFTTSDVLIWLINLGFLVMMEHK